MHGVEAGYSVVSKEPGATTPRESSQDHKAALMTGWRPAVGLLAILLWLLVPPVLPAWGATAGLHMSERGGDRRAQLSYVAAPGEANAVEIRFDWSDAVPLTRLHLPLSLRQRPTSLRTRSASARASTTGEPMAPCFQARAARHWRQRVPVSSRCVARSPARRVRWGRLLSSATAPMACA